MQSEVLVFRRVTGVCRARMAGSASSSQAEETNRIIYKCKIFIWDVSVAPLQSIIGGKSILCLSVKRLNCPCHF